jgi:protein involved in polysaccharide export with SLBB domain
MKKLLLVVVTFFTVAQIFAQTPGYSPAEMQAELNKRGLLQAEVEAKLKQKGININAITPANAAQYKSQIEQALNELEMEKNTAAGKQGSARQTNVAETKAAIPSTEIQGSQIDNIENKIKSKVIDETDKGKNLANDKADEIAKKVKEGASLEEAVSEGLLESEEVKPNSPIFGVDDFRNKSISVFRNSDDMKASESYVIGVGDELNVSIWGIAQYSGTLQVSKDGFIQPDRMPRIYVKGLTYGKAKEAIRSVFNRYYPFSNENFAVNVNYKRTLSVNIYGEVFKPGSYSISAINTAINALVAAGGPSDFGSVRNIKLIRAGQTPRIIDIYEYKKNPSVRDKFYLEDNDIIHVSALGKVVTIGGAVKRPFKYELLPNEGLMELIEYANGLAPIAYTENIQIRRFENDKEVLLDVKYKDLLNAKSNFKLNDGDYVTISAIPRKFENFATITGEVNIPKEYEILPNMKVSDLVSKAGVLPTTRTDVATLQRTNTDQTFTYIRLPLSEILKNTSNPENIVLQPKDKLIVYGLPDFSDKFNIVVEGAVRTPRTYPYDSKQSMKIDDAILLAGGLKPDATDFAYVTRKNINNEKEVEYIRVNLKEVLADPKSSQNLVLKPTDVLLIPSKQTYTDAYSVEVVGAVRNPNKIQYDETLTLRDAITLTGGMKLEAATNRIEVSRLVIQNNQPTRITVATLDLDGKSENISGANANFKLQPFDLVAVRAVAEFKMQQYVKLEGEVAYPGIYALISPNEKLSSVIERAGGLSREAFAEGATLYRTDQNMGAVVMKLDEAIKNSSSRYNYILKASDIITIPRNKELISINGAVRSTELYAQNVIAEGKINVPFHSRKRANFYINEYAAGFSKDANKNRVTVLQPSGKINKTKNLGLFKIYPKVTQGSVVTVGFKDIKPEKVDKEGGNKEQTDWAKIIANGVAQATGVISLIVLLRTASQL